MFKKILGWFKSGPLTANEINKVFGSDNDMARITNETDGKFTLYNDGMPIQTYSRKRDAVRGATRRGLKVA